MKYRSEIDGLRAVAVLPVILYHAGIDLFSGGFVGVDVFFVISGYLITTIIIDALDEGKFKLVKFYERRARRILPALFLTLIVTYLYSWFFMLPVAHKDIGQYAVSTVFFASNILLYIKGDVYFGVAYDDNPLLHMWSLAVEEQYYIIFPIFLMLSWVLGKRWIVAILVIAFVLSLGGAQWGAYHMPTATFYLLPTRGWELLVGAFTAFYLQNRGVPHSPTLRHFASTVGIFLIAFSIFYYDNQTPFPSLYTLVPTIGAALIILFAVDDTAVARILQNKAIVGIGLISYSAYLFHQPILVFFHLSKSVQPSGLELFICVSITFVLAYTSWYFVEKPFRNANIISTRVLCASSVFISVIIVSVGVAGHLTTGFPSRNDVFERLALNPGYGLQCNGNYQLNDMCSDSENPRIAVVGNSYAMQYVLALSRFFKSKGVLQLTKHSCSVGGGDGDVDNNESPCRTFYVQVAQSLAQLPYIDTVILSSPFDDLLTEDGLRSFTKYLKKIVSLGKRVKIIGPNPRAPFDAGRCIGNFYDADEENSAKKCNFEMKGKLRSKHFRKIKILNELTMSLEGVEFYDVTPFICDGMTCDMVRNDVLMYLDQGHLTKEASFAVIDEIYDNK